MNIGLSSSSLHCKETNVVDVPQVSGEVLESSDSHASGVLESMHVSLSGTSLDSEEAIVLDVPQISSEVLEATKCH